MNSTKTKIKNRLPVITDKLQELFDSFEDGQDILITIDKTPLSRSLAQNKYYHAVIKVYFFKLWRSVIEGITKEMTHEMIKRNFLPFEVETPKGEIVVLYRSTKSLSTKEMGEFIDACRGYYLGETGEDIPLPLYMQEEN